MALESIKRAAAQAATPQINRGSQDANVRKVESRQQVVSIADYADAPSNLSKADLLVIEQISILRSKLSPYSIFNSCWTS